MTGATARPVWATATYCTPMGEVMVEFASTDAATAARVAHARSSPATRLVQLEVEGADGRPVRVDGALLDEAFA